jgi:crotonobetainyl-CoA:carnitine CoA-transferase CaiB-like acyl-CoA transferase
VADVPPSPRFARTVLASVELSTGITVTPRETVVACSTPQVAAMYADLGFRVVPVEDMDEDAPARPWDVLELLAAGDEH